MAVIPLRDQNAVDPAPLPSNIEAEQALLGALLINNRARERVQEFLTPEHFSNAVHGRIFAVIGKTIDRGQVANPVTLKSLFDQDGALAEIGGGQYLARLAESAVTIINAEHYGRIIRDLHLRRELIAIGQDIAADAYREDLDDPAADQIERAEARLFGLADAGSGEGGLQPLDMGSAIQRAELAYKGQRTGLSTGLIDLDRKLGGGLQPADLVIVGARPSMGKTAFVTGIALHVASDGQPVAFFSLEMSRAQLNDRILAKEAGVPLERIRLGQTTQEEFNRFLKVQERVSQLPLHIDDTAGLSISALRARARRFKRRYGLGLVVVDYIQLMRGAARSRAIEVREREVAEISRALKEIAKELEVPLLAVSQLSRDVEKRGRDDQDNRPRLSDLRESGAIEQDGDVVMLLYRAEYYLSRANPTDPAKAAEVAGAIERHRNRAEVIIPKARQGSIGTVNLYCDLELMTFGNLAVR